MNENVISIIVAGGSGSRFGAPMPKQYCDLAGRPLLMTTIESFLPLIPHENIRLVIAPDMAEMWRQMCRDHGFVSPSIVWGGASRWESVKHAIESLDEMPDDTIVLIHDGARPFPSATTIADAIALDPTDDMRIPVVAVTDSLRQVNAAGGSAAVDRSQYRAVQTPQSALLGKLRKAYQLPYCNGFTDDASVMEAAGYTDIRLIDGSADNLKVTHPHDLSMAEIIVKSPYA